MTPADFATKLKNLTGKLEKLAPALAVQAGDEFLFTIKKRVFFEGKDTAGKLLQDGEYSTTPMYVNPATFPAAISGNKGGKPTGKFSKKTGKEGVGKSSFLHKAHEKQLATAKKLGANENITLYLPGGYKELRQKAGKSIDVVNLVLTGATKDSIKVIKTQDGAALAITEKKASQIMKGHTQKNGSPILQPSADEIKAVTKFVQNAVQIKINKLLGA